MNHRPAWLSLQWVIPVCVAIVILGVLFISFLFRQASPDEQKQVAAESAQQVVAQALVEWQNRNQPKPEPPQAPKPYYNFLTCEGIPENETCEPIFAYPITPEALSLIGPEPNTSGLINMERGRSILVQWRNMNGVNQCDLGIVIEPVSRPGSDHPTADRKLVPHKAAGQASFLDCTPGVTGPQGAVPTGGQS